MATIDLVRLCAARMGGLNLEELVVRQNCERCPRPHGRPRLTGHSKLHISLAHSHGVVAAAASTTDVGVDVERSDPSRLSPEAAQVVLAVGELAQAAASTDEGRALLRSWVRKEALVKVGVITLDTARSFDLSALPLCASPVLHPTGRGAVHLADLTDGSRCAVAAVAVASRGPLVVV